MGRTWQLHDAKNRLSQLVAQAASEGPQTITVRGRPAAVVLSIEAYRALRPSDGDLVDFFDRSPLKGVDLDLERSRDVGREVEL
jgi:antitoxin Phd